jgi:hypothetical protein
MALFAFFVDPVGFAVKTSQPHLFPVGEGQSLICAALMNF